MFDKFCLRGVLTLDIGVKLLLTLQCSAHSDVGQQLGEYICINTLSANYAQSVHTSSQFEI